MHVATFSEPGMASVNSYVVDAGDGVFVIDAQRTLSVARKFERVIAQTGKPVLAIFITHPHPDHIGGLPVLAAAYPDAPIHALRATRDAIQADAHGYIQQSVQLLGDDFDAEIPLPTHILSSGDLVTVGDLRLHVEDAGEGEALCMLMLSLPDQDTLFCADVVQHHMTAFLIEGHSEKWLDQVNRVRAGYGHVKTVYPGHGPSGPGNLLFDYQKHYLETFRALVSQQQLEDGSLTDTGRQAILAEMQSRYPGYLPVAMIPDLLDKDIDALAKEMQTHQPS